MIHPAEMKDLETLANLAALLWPHNTVSQLMEEFSEILSTKRARCFLQFENGQAVGFAQCQLRQDYVEGTHSSPVGYLEGIFVREDFRHRGYGKALLAACEAWAKACGCREFASDCALDNLDSFRFHQALGFAEASRIICFTKQL